MHCAMGNRSDKSPSTPAIPICVFVAVEGHPFGPNNERGLYRTVDGGKTSNGIASTIFPNILGNLDVPVVALNAYLDSRKNTRTEEEFDASLQQLAYVVTSLKYDIGCMFDARRRKKCLSLMNMVSSSTVTVL